VDETCSGRRPFQEAMADYQAARDERAMPMYEFTAELASLEPPPPELQRILQAAHGNQDAMDGVARVNAGVTSPAGSSPRPTSGAFSRPLTEAPAGHGSGRQPDRTRRRHVEWPQGLLDHQRSGAGDAD
jgi:hypothetical protein